MTGRPKRQWDVRTHLFWALVWMTLVVCAAFLSWFLAVQP